MPKITIGYESGGSRHDHGEYNLKDDSYEIYSIVIKILDLLSRQEERKEDEISPVEQTTTVYGEHYKGINTYNGLGS